MKRTLRTAMTVLVAFWMLFAFTALGSAQEYKALQGVQTVKTIFDFRISDPQNAVDHLQLVLDTYNAPAIQNISKKPDFVVVFMAGSVTLLSKDRAGFSEDDKQALTKMDQVISKLAKAGVRLEICEVAARFFKVDLNKVAPEIERVGNGWISSLGYQLQGYALIPVF